ncbi:MAG: hypothetical protein AAGB32_02730 [Pseudomonadota bacterium]
MIKLDLKVAWSIAAWELSYFKRGKLGEIARACFMREIRGIEKIISSYVPEIKTPYHLVVARPLIQQVLNQYAAKRLGINKIYAPILAEALNNVLEERGFSTQTQVFQSVRAPK